MFRSVSMELTVGEMCGLAWTTHRGRTNPRISTLEHAPRGDLCAHVETFHPLVGAEAVTLWIGVVGVQVADLFS